MIRRNTIHLRQITGHTFIALSLLAGYPPATAAASESPGGISMAEVPAASDAQTRTRLLKLANDYYLAWARLDPMTATDNGDNRFDDRLGHALVPAYIKKKFALDHAFVAQLKTIRRERLNQADRTNYDILASDLRRDLALEPFPEHLLPISQMDSVPIVLANAASGQGSQPLTTVKQYKAYLSRISQMPIWIDQAIANMREGMRKGIVQPRALMASVLPQYRQLMTETPEQSVFYTPIRNLPADFSETDKVALIAAYRSAIASKVQPSIKKLAAFIQKDYLPACRESAGIGALTNGRAWYQARILTQTGTTLTPEEIHQTGLNEVARIQAEFATIAPQIGYSGTPAGLPNWISAQDKYHPFTSEQEILDVYRQIDTKVRLHLPDLFTRLPKIPLDIRLEPELSRQTASDHYSPPAGDGSRPGVFWAVVNNPKDYGVAGMTTLFLHEGQPGHHFHYALMFEMNLPDFRRFDSNNAFTEGWALYAETLGKQMGLYDDPVAYAGHLTDELLRAARLVVDTGIHDKGWSRDQAIRYFRETLGYDEPTARSAIERYMAWPGQALGYKIGSLKIQALRDRAKAALGDKFSLAKFHDTVLSDGTLPLDLLEAKIDRWIDSQK